jgi:hypothetical protein
VSDYRNFNNKNEEEPMSVQMLSSIDPTPEHEKVQQSCERPPGSMWRALSPRRRHRCVAFQSATTLATASR